MGSSPAVDPALQGVAETLLMPLYGRALESQRPDAMMKDERAEALVRQMGYDFDQFRKIRMFEAHQVGRIMLTREIDRCVQDFLSLHPQAVVVNIGCGLDSRFERVDNGQVQWYDLDLPQVIALRRKFIADEGDRYHLLACSVFEEAWINAVKTQAEHAYLFVADTVLVYFTEAQVKNLVLNLRDQFPGAELVFDGWKPFFVWAGNRQFARANFDDLLCWGFWRAKTIEEWGEGIHLLDQWGFFDQPEPRMAPYRWIAPIFRLLKPLCVYRFRLGEAAA